MAGDACEMELKKCSCGDCDRPSYVKGLCTKHYQRVRLHGSTDGGKYHHYDSDAEAIKAQTRINDDGCIIWTGRVNANGYGLVSVRRKRAFAHRVAYEIKHGRIPDSMQVNHICDNPLCVNPDHLYAGTQKENIADMLSRRRCYRKGESAHNRKLNEKQVIEIRLLFGKLGRREIADKFGVSAQTITDIATRRSWSHI